MKIIIPIEFSRPGGVTRVIISLILHLIKYVDQVIVVLPKSKIAAFQALLPNTEKIVYESFHLEPKSLDSKLLSIFNKILPIARKLKLKKLKKRIRKKVEKFKTEARLKQLIRKHQADHCLYAIINRLKPPEVSIPLSGIAYDVFWRFSFLTYSDSYINKYEKPLLLWLEKATAIFTISQKTKDDILSIFPDVKYQEKLKPIPLAGIPSQINKNLDNDSHFEFISFYFPSSFAIYKDHLTLLKATIKLAQKGLKFKLIFSGKETDSLVNGTLKLSGQLKTKEYQEYLSQCQQIYQAHPEIFKNYLEGLGYCDYQQVEYYYQTCSCVIVPSKYEGFGLAISEAIMLGIPIIASDLEVFKEQIELYQSSDLVEFFPRGDVDALTECMERFIKSPKPRLSSSETEKRFSHWTWDDVAKKYIILLQEISNQR